MKNVDYGKIMALHDAGWNPDKIAEEMQMTQHEYLDAVSEKLDKLDGKIIQLEHAYARCACLILCPNRGV